MKLISWSKISKVIAPSLNLSGSKMFVMSLNEYSNSMQKSNYQVLKAKYSDLEEQTYFNKQILIIDEKSPQIKDLSKDLSTIGDVDVLDEVHYKKELVKVKQKGIGRCSLCNKELNDEDSLKNSMGPICEHKARQVEEDIVPLESFESKLKPLEVKKPQVGQTLVIKDQEGGFKFVEIVTQNGNDLEMVDRKKLRKLLNQGKTPQEAFSESYLVMKEGELIGAASLSDKEENKGEDLFGEMMRIFND